MKVKKNDILLIVGILAAAVILIFAGTMQKEPGKKIIIKVDGEIFGVYSLSENQELDIGNGNVCRISNGKAFMERADCPDQICVKTGEISHVGETIVCLPHRVVIEVEKENLKEDSDEFEPDTIAG